MSNRWPDSSIAPENLPICRGVYDLNTQWTRTPSIDTGRPLGEAERKTSRSQSAAGRATRNNAKSDVWIRLGHLLRRAWNSIRIPGPSTRDSGAGSRSNRFSGQGSSSRRAAPSASDWRAYGYWACPRVNGVNVNNRCTSAPSSVAP
jgi:hypothetical protein